MLTIILFGWILPYPFRPLNIKESAPTKKPWCSFSSHFQFICLWLSQRSAVFYSLLKFIILWAEHQRGVLDWAVEQATRDTQLHWNGLDFSNVKDRKYFKSFFPLSAGCAAQYTLPTSVERERAASSLQDRYPPWGQPRMGHAVASLGWQQQPEWGCPKLLLEAGSPDTTFGGRCQHTVCCQKTAKSSQADSGYGY